MYTRITIGNTSYTTGIESGSLYLNRLIVDSELVLGLPIANLFEVRMYGISDVSGQTINVVQYDDDENEIPLFTGKIESAKLDKNGYYRDIVAYDAFYALGDLDVSYWWEGYWSTINTSTVKALRQSLLSYVGLTENEVTLPNDTFTVNKTMAFSLVAFRDVMRVICEVQACFPNIDASGVVEYIIPDNTSESIETPEYRGQDSSFEDYTTPVYEAIKIYQNNVQYYSVGTGNAFVLTDNFLLKNMSPNALNTACQNILNVITNISYTPNELVMIESDSTIHLGDKYTTSKGTHFVFSEELKGIQFTEQTLVCRGEETTVESPSTNMQYTLLQNQISEVSEDGTIKYYEYHNGNIYNITNNTRKSVVSVKIASTKVTRVQIHVEINLTTADTDNNGYTIVKAQYTVNTDTQVLQPTETYIDGSHIMHLMYVLPLSANSITRFRVYLKAESGNIFIARGGIIALVSGVGIVGDGVWNGEIELEDEYSAIDYAPMCINSYSDSTDIDMYTPVRTGTTETYNNISYTEYLIVDFDETISTEVKEAEE